MTDNPAGFVREWWFHNATSYWFIAERSTATDEITKTYPASEVFNSRVVCCVPSLKKRIQHREERSRKELFSS